MKNAITLHRAMGAQVINHLSQFGNLPEKGILAGQAVDSAITDLFGHGGGVYNDLDIFRNVPIGERQGARNFANETAGRATLAVQEASEDYAGMRLALHLVQSYEIKSVSRQGMLNFVNCSMRKRERPGQLSVNQVLSGFDLNCTRVGVDLRTGDLVWDRHYEEFLRSRQLRIVMMHTPWHTFLRLAKKSEELPNVFVDFAAAAEACVGVASSTALESLKSSHNVSMLFGERHKAQAEATRSIWTPYFNLESKELHQMSGGYWRNLSEMTSSSEKEEFKKVTLYGLAPRGQLNSTLQDRCDNLGAAVMFFAQKVVDEARRTKPGSAYEKYTALTKHRMAATDKPDCDYVLMCAKLFGTDYVQGQALPEVGDKVSAWLAKHGGFKDSLLGLSLAQQHQVILNVTAVSKEFGDKHYDGDSQAGLGVLELQANTADLLSKEHMLAILQADFTINGVNFDVTSLPLPKVLPARFKDFVVKELLTGNALRREGKDMHHCVGGYSSQIRNKQSRIVSIKHLDEVNSHNCSTIEFRGQFHKDKFSEMGIHIGQNRTLLNKTPSSSNQELAKYLNGYLKVAELLVEGDVQQLAAEAHATAEAMRRTIQVSTDRIRVLDEETRRLRAELKLLETEVVPQAACEAILQELANDARLEMPETTVEGVDTEMHLLYEAICCEESDSSAALPGQALLSPGAVVPEPQALTVVQRLCRILGFSTPASGGQSISA